MDVIQPLRVDESQGPVSGEARSDWARRHHWMNSRNGRLAGQWARRYPIGRWPGYNRKIFPEELPVAEGGLTGSVDPYRVLVKLANLNHQSSFCPT